MHEYRPHPWKVQGLFVMSRPIKDIRGKRFGKLRAIKSTDKRTRNNSVIWECQCECGTIVYRDVASLTSSKIPSCGCLYRFKPGDKNGHLTIINDTGNRTSNGSVIWKCQCDCGKYINAPASGLKNGKKSCGCKHGMQKGEASFRLVLRSYINGAKSRGLKFELESEEFKFITKQNCFYCGRKPSMIMTNKDNTGDYLYNGVDRLDSSRGYTIENCVPCCTQCNYAKRDYKFTDFVNWIDTVYNNMFEKRHVLRAIDSIL